MTGQRATWIGSSAILFWSLSALCLSYTTEIPPFLLSALMMAVVFLCFLVKWNVRKTAWRSYFRQPLSVWSLGLYGISCYYAFYIGGMSLAPVVEANLCNYTWPLLLALFSAVLTGSRVRWFQGVGILSGFLGLIVLTLSRTSEGLAFDWQLGHTLALCGAVIWASYSALAKRFSHVESDATGIYFGAATIILFVLSVMSEPFVAVHAVQWLFIVIFGVTSFFAFYAWDIGIKHGDVQFLSAACYLVPVLSTGWLLLVGRSIATENLMLSCVLIIGGTMMAGWDKVQALYNRRLVKE